MSYMGMIILGIYSMTHSLACGMRQGAINKLILGCIPLYKYPSAYVRGMRDIWSDKINPKAY